MLNRNRFLLMLVAVLCFSSLLLAGPVAAEEQLGSDGVVRQTLQQLTPQPAYSIQEEGTGSITLQVQTGGALIDQWGVKVFQAEGEWMNELWLQLQITPSSDVQTVLISGFNDDPGQNYYVSMASNDALYLVTFTGAELGSTKIVQRDDSYFTLGLDLPLAEDGASIELHYRWPNGIRTHVGQVCAGAAIPAGNYSAQVWNWAESYSLFQPPVELSADTTLTFAADDIATVTTTIDLGTVNANLQRVETYQFPAAADFMNTVTHVQCLPGANAYDTNVSKGEYHTFGYVVRLTDSTGDYAYKFWRRDVGLSDELESTSLDLTEVQYLMDCRPVSPGETVYMGDLFTNGSFSYSRQPERWVVAKSTEDGDYLDPTGTLNLYHSSADLSSPVCSIRPEDGCFLIPADLPTGEYHAIFTPDSFGPVPLQFGTGTVRVEAGMTPSTTITGTLALPVSGAATVKLTATDVMNPEISFSTELSFDGSADTLSFEIQTGAFAGYHLKYEVLSGGEGLIPWGYYDGSQFVANHGGAVVVPGQTLVLTLPQSMPDYYQIVIHVKGEYYWSPSVWVQRAEQSGSSYRYVPVPDGPSDPLTIHSEPELGGMLLGISGLSFEPESNHYAVGISMGNALFPVEVTSAHLGNPITLTVVPDEYQPLAVSLPFEPDPADDLPIFLTGRDANGVAWLQGAVKPGAQIPEGVYDVHLAVQTGGNSYSLRAKDYTHSVDSSLVFDTSDLIALSVSVPEQVQVASAEQLTGSDQQTTMVPWAWDASTQHYSLLINKSVSYQQSVVYLEWNDWKYETVLSGDSLTQNLDLGAVAFQGKANLPKSSFLPGEEIWADSDSFSIVDQADRAWQVMRLYENRWIPAEGELLLTKSDGSDGIGCPFIFGRATLPYAAGSYQLSYQLPGSMLPINASLPVDITIGGAVVFGQVWQPDGTTPYEPSLNSWVDVSLRNLDSQREWWCGVDGNGNYAFIDAIPEGRYELTAMPRGQFGGSVPLEVTVDDEGTPTATNLTLTPAMISGWVLTPGSEGTAFVVGEQCDPDAGVQLYQVVGGKEVRAAQANIARDGSYSLGGNLPSGTYRLYANAWGNSNTYAPAIPLTLDYEAGTPVTEMNIALTEPLVIGQVLQPNGQGFSRENDSWADVCLRSPDGQERWFGTENNGRFIIGGDVPVGSYTLWAGARGDGNPYADGAGEPVLLEVGKTKIQNVSLALPTLSGRVLIPGGGHFHFIPTQTSTVDLCLRSDPNGPDLAWTGVHSDGTFMFGAVVTEGTYYLIAWDRGNDNPYARSLPEEVTIDDVGQTVVQDIALTSPVITGQVLVPDGSEPFTINFGENKGVHVTLRTADDNNTIVSDTALNWQPCNGSFRLGGNIPSGEYILYADTWGSDNLYTNAEPLPVTVQSGGPLTQNIRLTNPQLQGQVLAPDGNPISFGPGSWADLCLRNTDGRDVAWAGTDQDGNFSIGGNITTGDYYLFAFPRGAGSYARSLPVAVQITAGLQTQNIHLTTPGALLYTIAGELSLPDEDIAGESGITVVVKAIPRGFNEQGPIMLEDEAQVRNVVISAGEHAANYSISAPLPPEGFDYILQYTIDAGCIDDYPQYRETAFYSDLFSGQTVQYPIADWLGLSTTGDYPDKNLIITKLRTISGTVALPNQATVPDGGLAVTIYCVSGEGGWQQSYEQLAAQALGSTACTIAAGQSQAEFEINSLSPNERFIGWYDQFGHPEVQGYRLMYQFAAPDGSQVYGFFHPDGSVGSFAAAAWLDVTDQDVADVAVDLAAFAPAPNADVDGDGDVDVTDLALVAQAYGTDDADYDLNQNGRVDLYDLVLVAMQLNLQTN